jgi:hypothetical protein
MSYPGKCLTLNILSVANFGVPSWVIMNCATSFCSQENNSLLETQEPDRVELEDDFGFPLAPPAAKP